LFVLINFIKSFKSNMRVLKKLRKQKKILKKRNSEVLRRKIQSLNKLNILKNLNNFESN